MLWLQIRSLLRLKNNNVAAHNVKCLHVKVINYSLWNKSLQCNEICQCMLFNVKKGRQLIGFNARKKSHLAMAILTGRLTFREAILFQFKYKVSTFFQCEE